MADEININSDTNAGKLADDLDRYAASADRAKYTQNQLTESQRQNEEQTNKNVIANYGFVNSQERSANASELASKMLDESSKNLNEFSKLSNIASTNLSSFKEIMGSASEFIKDFSGSTRTARESFALINLSILGVRESFNKLSNVDLGDVNLLADEVSTDQFVGSVLKSLKDGGVSAVGGLFSNMFGSSVGKAAEDAAQKGTDVLVGFTKNVVTSVDNVRRLTTAQMQLAAATGTIDEVFRAAGPGLQSLNPLLLEQQSKIDNLSHAYGINNNIVQEYWSTINKIPGALNSTVKGYESSTSRVSALQGAILLATGAGRSFKEVADDMHSAIRFGAKDMDMATTFTSRISEITNNYGLELKDVRNHLIDLGNGFRFFGDQTLGATHLVNSYVGAIKETGVSGNVALEIVGQMTDGVGKLTLAQKAFLSAQTGGPGGLMGAFQIEKELRDGGIDTVFEKVRESMRKQMGEFVTLDEAATSRQAAAQLTKQIQILKAGPLGKFAQDDQSAIRILEGFKNLESGESIVKEIGGGEDGQASRRDMMRRGNDLLQRNNDPVTRSNRTLERQSNMSMIPTFNMFQRMMGGSDISIPAPENDQEFAEDAARKERLRLFKESTTSSLLNAGQNQDFINKAIADGDVVDRQNVLAGITTQGTINELSTILPATSKSMFETAKSMTSDLVSAVKMFNAAKESGLNNDQLMDIQTRAQLGDFKSADDISKLSAGTKIQNKENLNNLVASKSKPLFIEDSFSTSLLPTISQENKDFIQKQNLNDFGALAARRATEAVSKEQNIKNNQLQNKTSIESQQIEVTSNVKLEAMCIDCGRKMDSQHATTHGVPSK